MNHIYKSEIACENCKKPILWYALINKIAGVPISYCESDVAPYRQATTLSSKEKVATLRIRCKECDHMNTFTHTLSDD